MTQWIEIPLLLILGGAGGFLWGQKVERAAQAAAAGAKAVVNSVGQAAQSVKKSL